MIHLRRRQKRSQANKKTDRSADASKVTKPYLQSKTELEPEQSRSSELLAIETRYEKYCEDDIHEMPENDQRLASRVQRRAESLICTPCQKMG